MIDWLVCFLLFSATRVRCHTRSAFCHFYALSELLAFLPLPSKGKLNTHQFHWLSFSPCNSIAVLHYKFLCYDLLLEMRVHFTGKRSSKYTFSLFTALERIHLKLLVSSKLNLEVKILKVSLILIYVTKSRIWECAAEISSCADLKKIVAFSAYRLWIIALFFWLLGTSKYFPLALNMSQKCELARVMMLPSAYFLETCLNSHVPSLTVSLSSPRP